MQRMAEEIKELQAGLRVVVQALNFLQSFLESDYGLKFQFHAYRNSPVYSTNSPALEILKQKYPGNMDLQDSCYTGHERLFQQQHTSGSVGGHTSLLHFPNQAAAHGLEETVINTATTVCPTSYVAVTHSEEENTGDTSSIHPRQHTSSVIIVPENLSPGRSPIIVSEDELFGISDITRAMKEESPEPYQHNDTEMDVFNKPDFDDNDSDEDIARMRNVSISEVVAKKAQRSTIKRGRAKKEKITETFKCPHCRRRCSDSAKLELHMTHHKQQFQCTECGIWLADKSVLNRHMRTHTGDRPFKCIFCKDSFSRQDIVKKHIQRKHKGMVAENQISSSKFSESSTNS